MSDSIYFVESGGCALFSRRLSCRGERRLRELAPNSHFGEVSMIFNAPVLEKAVSTRYSLLARIRKEKFITLD